MIVPDPERRRDFFARIQSLNGWTGRKGTTTQVMERLSATMLDDTFPGAIIPRFRDGHFVYYVVTDTAAEWRRLSPMVKAAIGVTVSDFSGMETPRDHQDEFESLLASEQLHVARIEPVDAPPLRRRAAESLVELVVAFGRASELRQPSLQTTATLLRDFDLAVALRDRATASRILATLRSDLRMEGINHLFLEIDALASTDSWTEIWDSAFFVDAAKAFRPPRVTRALLRATYWTQIDEVIRDGDIEVALTRVKDDVLPRWGSLSAAQPTDTAADVVLPLAFAAVSQGVPLQPLDESTLESWDQHQLAAIRQLFDMGAVQVESAFPPPPAKELDLREKMRAELVNASLLAETSAIAEVRERLLALPEEDRRWVLDHPVAKRAWEVLEPVNLAVGVYDWLDWSARLVSLDLGQARCWAREAVTRYAVEDVLAERANAAAFGRQLVEAASNNEATLLAVLPYVLDWIGRDPEWPRMELRGLYRSLLDVLLLADEVSDVVVSGVGRLADAVLATGIAKDDYVGLCRDLSEWLGPVVAVSTIDRLADLVELTVVHPCPDGPAQKALWTSFLAALQPFSHRLDALQVSALKSLDVMLSGGLLTVELGTREEVRGDSVPEFVRGRVAVYTLVESVARRVKQQLEAAAPGLRVDLTTDKVGNDRLLVLAREADLFAIDWSRAKHAATDFIRQNRGARPIIFTSGSGSSSIAREVLEAVRANGGITRSSA